jgi:anti-sigma regulatory factor (Ser/Thr protein kinase)
MGPGRVGMFNSVKIRFDAGLDAPGGARRFVAQVLNDWGYQDLIDDATLVASELATNAVVHAQSPFTVELSASGNVIRISVSDSNPSSPARRPSSLVDLGSAVATSGRGLSLVAGIASDWGTEPVPDGKIVWAELRR